MKRIVISLFILFCMVGTKAFSQDIIVLMNGDEIKATVSEIDFEAIKYKKFENITGPIYLVKKSEVAEIKYANGTRDVFNRASQNNNVATAAAIANKTGSFTDPRDGKIYKTVTIGEQTWMAENLAYKTKNGCMAYNDNDSNVAKYGYLYNWGNAQKACPPGWHLPSKEEIIILAKSCGGGYFWKGEPFYQTEAANLTDEKHETVLKLKAKSGWGVNDTSTNASGFSALPGGMHTILGGGFKQIGEVGNWWTSSEDDDLINPENHVAYSYHIYCGVGFVFIQFLYPKGFGLSVRCVHN